MKRIHRFALVASALASCGSAVRAQACEGGVYLNPQVIRGEGTLQVAGAATELAGFIGRTGLSVAPVVSVSNLEDATAAVKRSPPPCWVYANPVVGLASGYLPAAVNMEAISAAVLVVTTDGAGTRDPKPVEFARLGADEQARVLAKLRQIRCLGIKSGVTTALVKAQKLCGGVVDVPSQPGLGQNYLPTKAAVEWHPDHWVGLITRDQSARAASMVDQVVADPQIHAARLVVVPARHSSWGYGLYMRPGVSDAVVAKVAAQFASLRQPGATLARALDLGTSFRFSAPYGAEVDAMRVDLDLAP